MKVLFISYYFEPFQGVGAKRMSYWANYCSAHGIESYVLTATEQLEKADNIEYIAPAPSQSPLRHFIKDDGLKWIQPLRDYFEQLTVFDYDAVIISGGPFMHFSIANYLFKRFNAKVVLDFRDPFSSNPSFKDNWVKRKIKGFFEKRFIKNATAIISVNQYCANLIVPHSKTLKIIDNGFNEKDFEIAMDATANELPIIAHAGTFIKGVRDPECFLGVMHIVFEGQLEFHHYGKDSDYFKAYQETGFFKNNGLVPYGTLIKKLQSVDICLLITEGEKFESTTKIFDYIGLNKKILVVTSGEKRTGNIHNLTVDYPNIEWCYNTPEDIEKGINDLLNRATLPHDPQPYSRAASLDKLVNLLKSI